MKTVLLAVMALVGVILTVESAAAGKQPTYPTIHMAAERGDVEDVKRHLRRGVSVNAKDAYYGRTPLHAAAASAQTKVAKLLIENGADVNAKDKNGNTPMHTTAWASWTDDVETVMLLVANGGDVNAKNNDGNTPLHLVAMKVSGQRGDSWQIAGFLIENGADVNAKNKKGRTPLELTGWYPREGLVAPMPGVFAVERPRESKTADLLRKHGGMWGGKTWSVTEPAQRPQVQRLDLENDSINVGPEHEKAFLVKDEILIERGLGIVQKIVDALPGKLGQVVDTWWFGVVEGDNAYGQEAEGSGYVVAGQKLLESSLTDEIAFVIAHEVAHIVLQHRVLELGMEPMPLLPWFYEKQLSKEQELAADDWAVTFMQSAGFDANGAVRYLEAKIREEGPLAGAIIEVLSFALSHPPYSERLAVVKSRMDNPRVAASPHRLTALVTDQHGEPVVDAAVWLVNPSTYGECGHSQTDRRGHVEIDINSVSEGSYVLFVIRGLDTSHWHALRRTDLYEPQKREIRITGQARAEGISLGTITLRKWYRIAARITDKSGSPYRHWGVIGVYTIGSSTPSARGRTDDDGRFRTQPLPDGVYRLTIRSSPMGGKLVEREVTVSGDDVDLGEIVIPE